MRTFSILALISIAILATGCGTATGLIAGPLIGGTSLTAKMYGSDVSAGTKALGTPFVFTAGTCVGVFPAVAEGINKDVNGRWGSDDFLNVLDPFDAGLFGE